jgi:signal transduction histidine kinase
MTLTNPPGANGLIAALFSKLSLSGKFSVPIGILIFAIIIGFVLGFFVKLRTDAFLAEMSGLHQPRLEHATDARNSFATAKLHAIHFFLTPNATQRAADRHAFYAWLNATDDELKRFMDLGGAQFVVDAAGEVRRTLLSIRAIDPESVAASVDFGYSAGDLADLFISRTDLSPALESLLDVARDEMAAAQQRAEALRVTTVRFVGGLAVLALVASVLSMRWVVRTQLAAPLQRLHARMMDIAAEPVEHLAAHPGLTDHPSLTSPIPEIDRGDELGAVASAIDLLRQDKALAVLLTRRLQAARDELAEQAKMAALGTMVAGVAHEINTPIGICITGSSGVMEEIEDLLAAQSAGSLDPAELSEALQRINDYAVLMLANMRRAGALVASFKQISIDQTADAEREFELGSYVRQILETLGPELVKAKVATVIDCPSPIEITTRPSAIWQILSNLILNAAKHAFHDDGQGGPRRAPLVTVVLRREQGRIRIEVADNGAGIPEDERRHVFDPFFTTRRREGGSGLGLTIVYNLVTRSLNGSISCVSRPGSGARFVISFPENPNPAPL